MNEVMHTHQAGRQGYLLQSLQLTVLSCLVPQGTGELLLEQEALVLQHTSLCPFKSQAIVSILREGHCAAA